jgi:ElaB/YqjD/DUF883 family membrane-anchored ribosome-binding protein
MTSTIDDASAADPTVHDRSVDAVRQVAHVAHEARLLKTLASDAVEDAVHASRRAARHGIQNLEDLRDSAAYAIKRAPLVTVGLAFAAGIVLGVAFGRIGRKAEKRDR